MKNSKNEKKKANYAVFKLRMVKIMVEGFLSRYVGECSFKVDMDHTLTRAAAQKMRRQTENRR